MSSARLWQLPDGVEALLPDEATRIEHLRRLVLNVFDGYGYQQVIPPPFEFLDSLDIDTQDDLFLSTFTLLDSISGRMLGVRADMTSQVTRMDAYSLPASPTRRLCYSGEVFLARRPGINGDRCPLKIGAELYGHEGVESDVEIIELMLAALTVAGIENLHLNLGHMGIYRSLVADAGIPAVQEARLFKAIQVKASADIGSLTTALDIRKPLSDQLLELPELMGGPEILDKAGKIFATGSEATGRALAELVTVTELLQSRQPQLMTSFDLAELRGYRYHNGLVFTAYANDHEQPVASGGRYHGIDKTLDNVRFATGFDADLKTLAELSALARPEKRTVHAPFCGPDEKATAALLTRVHELRQAGVCVVTELPGTLKPRAIPGEHRLAWNEDTSCWSIDIDGAHSTAPVGMGNSR